MTDSDIPPTTTASAVDRPALVRAWIAAANAFDTAGFIGFFTADAVLDDPGVDRFEGVERIAEYFTDYFIGYRTTTEIVEITETGDRLHVVVDFTGTFPGGQVGGTFDIDAAGDRFALVRADLI
jgi:ketosteroid isomerase-like protein